MAAQATIVSDGASPLQPRKAPSPYVARTSQMFEKTTPFSQGSDTFSYVDSPILSNYRTAPSSRRGSFNLSTAAFNCTNVTTNVSANTIRSSFSMANLPNQNNKSRPFEKGKVCNLETSFSNPGFHSNHINNSHQTGLNRVLSKSVILEQSPEEQCISCQPIDESQSIRPSADSHVLQPRNEKMDNVVDEDLDNEIDAEVEESNSNINGNIPQAIVGAMLSHSPPPIGPIARMNCRESIMTDEEKGSYQLISIQFKERVRSHTNVSNDGAPCLELDAFSPYSPGIPNLGSDIAFSHQTENHNSINLGDFMETIDFGGNGMFDYLSHAVGSSQFVVEEAVNLELIPSDLIMASSGVGEATEKRDQHQLQTLEGDALSAYSETPVAKSPITQTLKKTENAVKADKDGDRADMAQEIIQMTAAIRQSSVDIDTPVASPEPTCEKYLTPTVNPVNTFESKENYIPRVSHSQLALNQPIQRQGGSMTLQSFPQDSLRGSQLLEKRNQRLGSNHRLNGSSLLHLTTSRQSNHSGPSSMLASSSTTGSTASSATRLYTPQTCNDSTFERNIAMSEDDTSMPFTSGQSTDHDRSSIQSSAEMDASVAAAAALGTPPTTNKKSAKIVTRPKGLSMALGRTFSMMLDITSAATTVGFDDSHEHVVSSKVSRTGKLFAQKIKTIANFEYNTSKKLGKGNFGVVYQGKSIRGSDEVAIKKITRKLPGEIEKLGLTGIVPLLDIITTNKHHYLVFEKAEGDLAEMIKARCKDATGVERINRDPYQQPMSPSCTLGVIFTINEIRSIMRTVVLGTQSLHHEGFSHKDIKPANILFRDGHGLLCDFGLCSRREELPDNQFFGTQDYASPEARRVGDSRKCDYIQGDVYSLGAVLYELATGAVLSKVISQGINWQKLALFGGRSFSELIQGMVDDLEKRWNIDRVVNSRFWEELQSDSASTMTAVSDSSFSPFSATVFKATRQSNGAGGDNIQTANTAAVDNTATTS
ncbi:hypothetical protein FBU30_010597 [Linnemannia zychae]|nr:hypothetical protein FBU30_010597 [Linnemannia zychae]